MHKCDRKSPLDEAINFWRKTENLCLPSRRLPLDPTRTGVADAPITDATPWQTPNEAAQLIDLLPRSSYLPKVYTSFVHAKNMSLHQASASKKKNTQ